MSKRLLYLEDLYNFYSTYKKSTHFSAENKEPLVVQVVGKINFEENNDSTEGLTRVHLQSCHTGLNRNSSNIDTAVMESALVSFKNRPILGFIHYVDGKPEFYSHNMHEEDGEIVYDEAPVGIIPESCNAKIVYDEDKGKSYVEVDGYLFDEYSKATEILKREKECFVSVELSIRELSYEAKEKYLNIEDFFFSGVTILGKTPDGDIVQPGMESANIKLADFSQSNNSLFSDKLDSLTSKVDLLLSRFDNMQDNSKEGGNDSQMFEELLEKYNKTVDDIDFEYETMSDEELEAKFAELFGEGESDNTDDTQTDNDTQDDVNTGNEDNTDDDTSDNADSDDSTDDNPSDDGDATDKTAYSKEELFNQLFDISFNEIQHALNALCSIYRNNDEWCYVSQVYDDYFIMEDWDNNKFYKQSYEKDGDNISLVGERIQMFAVMVTESEKIALDEMRSNYTALVEFKETVEKNELHAKREEILANEKYSSISETDAFKKLYSEMDNYSLEELEKEAKIIFADNINVAQFSAIEKKNDIKVFANVNKTKKDSRYGNLFSK